MTRESNKCWSLFKRTRPADTKLRRQQRSAEPVEVLEQRLCLGSMHSGLADWSRLESSSEPAEVRLAGEYGKDTGLLAESENQKSKGRDGDLCELDSSCPKPGATTQAPSQSIAIAISHPFSASRVASGLGSPNLTSASLAGPMESNSAPAVETRLDRIADRLQPNSQDLDIGTRQAQVPAANSRSNSTSIDNSNQPSRPQQPAIDQVNFRHREAAAPIRWDSSLLASIGLQLDDNGNAVGFANTNSAQQSGYDAWWLAADEPVVIKYDFRDLNGHANQITGEQRELAVRALDAWSMATDRQIVFEHDLEAADNRIINIGVGNLAAVGHVSGEGAVLGLGGGQVTSDGDQLVSSGLAWLDQAESWDTVIGNGNPVGTFDFSTTVAHELGHAIGYNDLSRTSDNIMNGTYLGELGSDAIQNAVNHANMYLAVQSETASAIELHPMVTGPPQLDQSEVEQLLARASVASASQDAIIAVVDRNGRILGVRVESEALAAIPDVDTLVFAIDGAVAKARTAALFSAGDPASGTVAPLTSRTVRFLSQSTITQREVESNPNVDNGSLAEALDSTVRGPGFVAPIGVGGHFPPEINFTPLVDLFGIEHTNRDSTRHPGVDGIKGTADDIFLDERFNIDSNFVDPGQNLTAPESYGAAQNSGLLLHAQSRGIATLPGGVPLFRDSDTVGPRDGFGDTLVGGIGVFFPGSDGFATHEQGFVPGIGQTETQRTNASRVLEAEYIAFVAAGGSLGAERAGLIGAKVGTINGVAPVAHLDIPFGRLDLVGIQLDAFGPMGSRMGLETLIEFGQTLGVGADSGSDQVVDGVGGDLYRDGESVPEGWLVQPHDSADGSITAADVERIINNSITAAENVRAAIRLPLSQSTRMVMAVTDTNGEVLGLFRMPDATTFSIDVAVAKARNVAYYADAGDVQAIDLVGEPGVAYTNRTFRFLAQPRFPSGINGTNPAPFSTLHDGNVNQLTAENLGAPAPVSAFVDAAPDDTPSVLGYDAFFPNTNFRDPGDGVNPAGSPDPYHTGHNTIANQNGIVFFPGSTPLYKDGVLIGGLGVSGDGVDQDDVVTYIGASGFLPESHGITRADQTFVRDIRLPYQKFLRNPFGGFC